MKRLLRCRRLDVPDLDSFRNGTAAALAAPCHVETPLPTTFWPPVAEIENFTVSPPGAFNVTGWGRDHYFGATFSNSFASRMALLHAPAAAAGVASGKLTVPSSGTWYVWCGTRHRTTLRPSSP